jgi:Cof subfamily protein (haloacid dehalogenase superfamily)
VHVVVATGRMFRSVRPFALEAGLEGPLICYQGALVAEAGSGKVLSHHPIELEAARFAIGVIEAEGFGVNLYVDDELVVAEETPEARYYADYQGVPVPINAVGNLLAWLDTPPTKLVVVSEPDELDGLERTLRERLEPGLHVVRSLPVFLEVAAAGVTKGTGLEIVSRILGFTPARTVAFGDERNDFELLEWAGYTVVPEGSRPEVLPLADLVCPPVEEEGVAQVIEAYLGDWRA